MKKKILIIVVVVVVLVGGTVAALALTGGGVSEKDNAQGEDTHEDLKKIYEDSSAMEKPKADIDDSYSDSLENKLDLQDAEDFNAADML